jgi:hypothetical protein
MARLWRTTVACLALAAAACGRFGFPASDAGADDSVDADADVGDGGVDAAVLCFAQFDDEVFADGVSVGSPGELLAIKIVTPATTLDVIRLEVFTGEVTGGSTLGLWDHAVAGDEPGSVMTQNTFTIVPALGWQGADLAAPLQVAPSTTLWFVWTILNGAQASVRANGPGSTHKVRLMGNTAWMGPYMIYQNKLRMYCR